METFYSPKVRPNRNVCVLLNSRSGTANHDQVRAAVDRASRSNRIRFELRVLEQGSNLRRIVSDAVGASFDTVVAAGGDGTITGVASALQGTGATMGILPQGTFNYVARGLGIPLDVDRAIDLIAEGHTRDFPVGHVNGQVFLNNANLGLYPEVLKQREGTYKRWGRSRIAAHWSVLRTFLTFRKSMRVDLTVDGQTHHLKTPLIFVARSAYQLESFGLAGADQVRDGKLAVFVAPRMSRAALLTRALRLAGNGMQETRDFMLFCGDDVEITTRRSERTVAMDGERMLMRGPFRFGVARNRLQVIAPRLNSA
ncbi:diacylglycerol/lipid kinase family protein [Pseudoprimorskyibacter insulae]|uniref:Diacylglycerol kinase n=1 Tax=Pseudoprimorskyibacter insulae TaxID=1695997 RepID=A0A2R8AQW0_9RHOB|nr:diacylglycerol kinase family protein [Pseudoprimorskyibacter insulae]SPF78476.1 Diacylglycerol kinase [Pseudoprimorskyibacter insulae]